MSSPKKPAGGIQLPHGILTPTARPDGPEEVLEPVEQGQAEQGQADLEGPRDEQRPARKRTRRAAPERTEKLEGRRLYLSDATYTRLRFYAMSKKIKLSEAAEEVLDRNLPRWDHRRIG